MYCSQILLLTLFKVRRISGHLAISKVKLFSKIVFIFHLVPVCTFEQTDSNLIFFYVWIVSVTTKDIPKCLNKKVTYVIKCYNGQVNRNYMKLNHRGNCFVKHVEKW
jgi:hypothetical protein